MLFLRQTAEHSSPGGTQDLTLSLYRYFNSPIVLHLFKSVIDKNHFVQNRTELENAKIFCKFE